MKRPYGRLQALNPIIQTLSTMKTMKTRLLLFTPLVALVMALTASIVYAATNSTSTTISPAIGTLTVTDIAVGMLSAAIYGALGYYTDLEKNPAEKFNSKQFALTVGIGAILGLFIPIAQPTDLSGLAAAGLVAFTNFGAIYFIQKLLTIAHTLHPLTPAK